jgi:hypothetical protein
VTCLKKEKTKVSDFVNFARGEVVKLKNSTLITVIGTNLFYLSLFLSPFTVKEWRLYFLFLSIQVLQLGLYFLFSKKSSLYREGGGWKKFYMIGTFSTFHFLLGLNFCWELPSQSEHKYMLLLVMGFFFNNQDFRGVFTFSQIIEETALTNKVPTKKYVWVGTCSGSHYFSQSSLQSILLGALHELTINQTINNVPEWPEKTRQAKIALKKALALKGFVPDSEHAYLMPTESENSEVLNTRYLLDVLTTYKHWVSVPCDEPKKNRIIAVGLLLECLLTYVVPDKSEPVWLSYINTYIATKNMRLAIWRYAPSLMRLPGADVEWDKKEAQRLEDQKKTVILCVGCVVILAGVCVLIAVIVTGEI